MKYQLTIDVPEGATAEDLTAALHRNADQLERSYEGRDQSPFPEAGERGVIMSADDATSQDAVIGTWSFD